MDMSIPNCDLVIPVTNAVKIISDITENRNKFFLKYLVLIKYRYNAKNINPIDVESIKDSLMSFVKIKYLAKIFPKNENENRKDLNL